MKISQERKYDIIDNKIVNRATGIPIPDDEPIMIFRGKDKKTIKMLYYYLGYCTNLLHRKVIQGRIDDFKAFQNENPDIVKEPDSDASALPPSGLGET